MPVPAVDLRDVRGLLNRELLCASEAMDVVREPATELLRGCRFRLRLGGSSSSSVGEVRSASHNWKIAVSEGLLSPASSAPT